MAFDLQPHNRGETSGARRGRGRPRQPDIDTRVLEAALDELCETGIDGVTFDGLAARSGVAKTTIYRRWRRKTDLLVDAIDLLRERAPVPDTGDVRADLAGAVDNLQRAFTSRHARAIATVMAGRLHDDELRQAWHERIAEPHQDAFRAVLHRGIASGDISPDIDVDTAHAVIVGITFIVLFELLPFAAPGLGQLTVDMVLDGIGHT